MARGGKDQPILGRRDCEPASDAVNVIHPELGPNAGCLAPSRQGGGTAEMAL